MTLDVLSAGPMLTVQDAGRFGLRHMGVSPAGPIDRAAMALANGLVGNAPGAAALEFAGPAGSFRCDRPVRFAIAAADCVIRIDKRVVLAGESHRLNPGETLTVGAPDGAVWAYLAFSGGLDLPGVLGSCATHLRSGLGGIEGRAVRAGDRLPLGEQTPDAPCLRPESPVFLHEEGPIRLVLGPQDSSFSPEVIRSLTEREFIVTPQRDRMAMVLGGVELPAAKGHDIVSDGTVPGSVQVPGSGMPLVLLAESQTTGGYPKIGTVASVDLARLAQMPVGARFRFSLVTPAEGEDLWIAKQARLRQMLRSFVAKPESVLRSDYLLSCELVGGFYDVEEILRPVTLPDRDRRP
ncbi:allophanate hydrolase [Cereibacter changlensis JA139]|uniref:Allophanate hydrolase n=2 Tax=Cereibacter changlensis TaxID=402884 RepID=A0A2T4JYG3_9RHOB|nr:biotin-dependent carboxyltransferase family protein [Cereibacter changlensis]PTE22793.1 allophanate hydrolase [Cereibacter changlensis JA139]PZX52395.1 allophanate hydrolase [Cereibacter changlensis]